MGESQGPVSRVLRQEGMLTHQGSIVWGPPIPRPWIPQGGVDPPPPPPAVVQADCPYLEMMFGSGDPVVSARRGPMIGRGGGGGWWLADCSICWWHSGRFLVVKVTSPGLVVPVWGERGLAPWIWQQSRHGRIIELSNICGSEIWIGDLMTSRAPVETGVIGYTYLCPPSSAPSHPQEVGQNAEESTAIVLCLDGGLSPDRILSLMHVCVVNAYSSEQGLTLSEGRRLELLVASGPNRSTV